MYIHLLHNVLVCLFLNNVRDEDPIIKNYINTMKISLLWDSQRKHNNKRNNILINMTIKPFLSSPPVFSSVRVTRSLVLCVCLVDNMFVPLSFFFWPLCCLFFFNVRLLITTMLFLE